MLRETLVSLVPNWLVNPLIFVSVAVVFYIIGKLAVKPIVSTVLSKKIKAMGNLIGKISLYTTVIIGLAVGLTSAGYSEVLRSFGTIVAAGTVAIGFAMQDSVSSVVAGIFIVMDKPFELGDWIEWDGKAGIVEDIGLRTTVVQTFDKEKLTVPNNELANTTIKNPVDGDNVRVQLDIGIGYDSDIKKAKQIVEDILRDMETIADEPAPDMKLVSLGDSSIDFKARYWIDSPKRANFVKTREKVLHKVKQRFDAEGIDIPYPTTTIAGDSLEIREK